MQKLGDRLVEILLNYANNYTSLTDEQSTALLDDYLAVQKDETKIKMDWVPKFRKILPSKTVTRMYQIDNKLDAIIRFDAAEKPLVLSRPRSERVQHLRMLHWLLPRSWR